MKTERKKNVFFFIVLIHSPSFSSSSSNLLFIVYSVVLITGKFFSFVLLLLRCHIICLLHLRCDYLWFYSNWELGFLDMGGSKCSSIATSSSSNLPRCGCELPMKLWVSNTRLNPKRRFWKCRNSGVTIIRIYIMFCQLYEFEWRFVNNYVLAFIWIFADFW
jgi:hypothetical protein